MFGESRDQEEVYVFGHDHPSEEAEFEFFTSIAEVVGKVILDRIVREEGKAIMA